MRFGRRKYGNTKTRLNGVAFDSQRECRHYIYFKSLEKAGEISNLQRQVPFELIPAIYKEEEIQLKTKTKVVRKCVQRATHYVADFVYEKDGRTFVVDSKGVRTPEYKLKKKMMLAFKGIEIVEI